MLGAVEVTLGAASAGFGAMGDQAATIVAHGLDAAQATGTIIQAVIEEDPLAGVRGILSGVFEAISVDQTIQTSGANNASQHAQKVCKDAKRNVSELAKRVRAGGTVGDGVKIGGKMYKSLHQAAKARDALKIMSDAALMTAEQANDLQRVFDTLKEAFGLGDEFLEYLDKLESLEPNVMAEKA